MSDTPETPVAPTGDEAENTQAAPVAEETTAQPAAEQEQVPTEADLPAEEEVPEPTVVQLKDITPLTRDEQVEKTRLLSEEESQNGVSAEESTRRSALIFKQQANNFKALAQDNIIDEKADANYEFQALRNWAAYAKTL